MNIGDRVRLVHGKEEGIIYRFLAGNLIELEIEDGFRIPVLQSEVVLVSPMEKARLLKGEPVTRPTASAASSRGVFSEKGLYLVFVPVNDREVSVHFINNTDWILPFVVYQEREGKQSGLAAGTLEAKTTSKLTDLLMKDFEEWPTFDIQALYFKKGNGSIPKSFQKRLKCRAQSFYKRKQKAPLLDKDAYVYQLDEEGSATQIFEKPGINAEELRERMLNPQSTTSTASRNLPASVVDLHLDKLNPPVENLSSAEKLAFQLRTFETQLEQAIAAGMDEITFIHGAGNGVLRNELQRRLGKNQQVQYFKDAQKEKFGYGATYIKIK